MKYTIWYKQPNRFFWKKLKNVIADGIIPDFTNLRYFLLEDKSRIEIPTTYQFKFCPNRAELIENQEDIK